MNLLAEQIKSEALSMGYEKCGIIKISDMSGYEEKLNERIERIPEVKPYYEGFYRFAHLQDTYPWAKSIVICVRQYGKYHIPEHLKGSIAKYYLVDSRRDENSQDYQDSLKFESYMQKMGFKTATERKFGITALRWEAGYLGAMFAHLIKIHGQRMKMRMCEIWQNGFCQSYKVRHFKLV